MGKLFGAGSLTKKRAKPVVASAILLCALAFGVALFARSAPCAAVLSILESRFPSWRDDDPALVSGVIALGGTFSGAQSPGERMEAAVRLSRRYPLARILYSGMEEVAGAGARDAAAFLASEGVAPSRVIIEGHSENTSQNARFSSRLVKPRPDELWLLTTSAAHMPRAIGAFRAAGFSVAAYPVEYKRDDTRACRVALKEIVGLALYRLTGRTQSLFPRP